MFEKMRPWLVLAGFVIASTLWTGCSGKEVDLQYEASGRKNYDLGMVEVKKGNFGNAAEQFSRAVEKNKTQSAYYVNLGYAMYRLKLFAKAKVALLQAVRINPKSKEGWYNLALTYEALGENSKADQAFAQYSGLTP